MTLKIIIAGSGGQGIMLLGKVLAMCAMKETKFVTWLPAYGAEVRGGSAHCAVVISDEPIGSPYVSIADALIAMNGSSLVKFRPRLKEGGLCLVNSSLVDEGLSGGEKVVALPFTQEAAELGNIKIANMVALGSLISLTKIVGLKTALGVIAGIAPKGKKDLITMNTRALERGIQLVKEAEATR